MRHSLLLLLALGLLTAPLGCPSGDDDDTANGHNGANDDDTIANDDDVADDDDIANDDDDDSGGDDDDSTEGWPGPGPEGAVVGLVLISIDEEHGDDDDDDDAADDDDSATEPGAPVPGLTVTEVGTSNTAVTDFDGTFVLIMEDYEPAQISIQVPGDRQRILVINEAGYRAVAGVIENTASTEEHELDLYQELYGGAFNGSLGTVDVTFLANLNDDLTGATASLDGAALGPRVLQDPDITVEGNAVLAGNESIVFFGNVTPGNQSLAVTPPSGFECFAPASVLVVADTITKVVVGCRAD